MLIEIKRYMIKRRRVPLRDLALRFDTDPDAMRGMLGSWIRKGKVVKCDAISCGGCSANCTTAQQEEAYEWTEKAI